MFTRVLVPLDGGPKSAAALPLARATGRAAGVAISLLQVVWSEEQATQARHSLEWIARELASTGLHVEARFVGPLCPLKPAASAAESGSPQAPGSFGLLAR